MACGYGPIFHTVKPALLLDFSGKQNLVDRISGNNYITFTRASALGYYFDNTGKLVTATTNTPRFEYDPITLQCKGLLIEPQRTNYALQSLAIGTTSNTFWSKANNATASGTPTTTTPLVTTTVSAIRVGITGTAACVQNVSYGGATGAVCFSVYAKAGTSNTVVNKFVLRDVTNGQDLIGASIDYGTGVATVLPDTNNAPAALVTTSNAGNGWWRISLVAGSGVVIGTALRLYVGLVGDADRVAAGAAGAVAETAGNYAWFWGAQLEDGENATSLITTTTGTVQRAPDVVTLGSFSRWYNGTQGCFLVDASLNWPYKLNSSVLQSPAFMDIQLGTGNTDRVLVENTDTQSDLTVTSGGVVLTPSTALSGVWKPGYFNRFAFNYTSSSITSVFNGATAITTSISNWPSGLNNMAIGGTLDSKNSSYLNGYIRSITYYATPATNANLYAMTLGGGSTGYTIEGGGGGGGGGAVTI